MANKTSQHILSVSANLLGFCLFVITALHFSDKEELTLIDETTAIMSFVLATSCVLSFLSIRTNKVRMEERLEVIAEYLFMIALIGITVVILLIALHFLK